MVAGINLRCIIIWGHVVFKAMYSLGCLSALKQVYVNKHPHKSRQDMMFHCIFIVLTLHRKMVTTKLQSALTIARCCQKEQAGTHISIDERISGKTT